MWKHFPCLVFFLMTVNLATTSVAGEFKMLGDREYFVSPELVTFKQAYLNCRQFNMQLLTFSGVSELITLWTHIDPGTWWTGAYKTQMLKGVWAFISTGELISASLELELIKLTTPSQSLDRQCSTLTKTDWTTEECGNLHTFICEHPIAKTDPDENRHCTLNLPTSYSMCTEYVVCDGKTTLSLKTY